jgi:RNA polymerase sigma-70 factor (ECF subfamily)
MKISCLFLEEVTRKVCALGNPFPQRALFIPIAPGTKTPRVRRSNSPPHTELTDEALLFSLANSDFGSAGKDVLVVLFDRYSRLIYSIAFRILRDRGESEELVQEVFLYLYEQSSHFNPSRGEAKQWIVQLAYHRALDRKAHLARRRFWSGTDLHELGDTLTDGYDVEREVSHRLDRAHLQHALLDLPEKQRRTLELFFFHDLTLREISEKTGDLLSNVRHHYYRGLEKLRQNSFVQKVGNI